MGFLGGDVTIHNETQYKWTVCIESQEPWPKSDFYMTFTVEPYGKKVREFVVPITAIRKIYINVKYGDCSERDCYKNPHLWYRMDIKDDPYFTIRESGDHQQIHLDCNIHYERKKSTCSNYGKIEDDAREEEERRRREEEQRRQEEEEQRRLEEERRRLEEEQRRRIEEQRRRIEEQRRREEEEQRRREEEEQRRREEEEQRRRKEEEQRRLEEELRRRIEKRCRRIEERRRLEEEQRRRIEEQRRQIEEQRRREEEEQRRREEEEQRRREEEEQRRRKEEEQRRLEEELRRRIEKRCRRIEEQCRREEEQRRREEEQRRRIEEQRRRIEEQRRREEEEQHRRIEEQRRRIEEQRRREKEEQRRREEKEQRRLEEEQRRLEEELRRRIEEQRRQEKEEQRRREKEEQRRREEEEQHRLEEELRRRIEEQRRQEKEEQRRREKEEQRRREEEEQRRLEEELRRRIEEQRRQEKEEQRRREKEEQRRREEEEQRRQEKEQRRQEEEQRRQAQLERERRIEEQIKRESELTAKKLSQATETLKQRQRLRGHEVHHQTHIMQQPLDAEIEIDEVPEMEKKFMELLFEYQITEDEDSEETLADRMKTLQNELMVEFCKKHNLSSSCVFSFSNGVGYETLPLHDRLSVLEAVMRLVLEENEEDHTQKHERDFLLDLPELLQDDHPSLAFNLLQSILQTDMQLSTQSKEILCQIAFNNTWKLPEITDFMRKHFGKDKEQVQSILHIAQTYKLEYGSVFTALGSADPLRGLKSYVDKERHKNADTVISEMRKANYPENVLIILEDVLGYLEMELPKYKTASLSEKNIQNVKKMIRELDFNNPDRQVLKHVLVGMSVAVKICSAVTIQRGKKEIVIEGYLPRLTQLATLIVFLLPKSKTNTGCLLEIGTGEGKSCILAMLAAIHAIRGVKVDIVTSSPVLACRDLEEWSGLYNMFGITSSAVPPMLNDVSSEKQEELTQEAYKQQIIYSTVGTFAADTLKQEFEKKTTRGDRRFELVVVDEVDYMTLDNGVQITFLSHEASGLQHLEQVLASIWAMISACRPIETEDTGETMWTTRVQNFHTAALIAMIGSEKSDTFSPLEILLPGTELGFYSEEDFENLKLSINDEGEKQRVTVENEAWKTIMAKTGIDQQYDLLSVLEMGMEQKVAFNCYIYQSETRKAIQFGEKKAKTDQNINMLLLENGKACEILSENLLVDATVSQLKSKIKYSKQCSSKEGDNTLVIPSFLEKYLENQLPVFVENALKAIQMTKGREYMIERSLSAQGIDVSEEDQHMYHAIIPVDFQASGMLEKRKRWGDGLQQFLEMKHQLTLSPLSHVTNYMSNSNFFKRYLSGKGIFGVSGTLGGDADKGFLARHYKTDSYVIPAHQRQKVTELPAVQVRGGTEQWLQTLCATVSKVSDRGQVVLVVCEDVNTANALKEKVKAESKHSVTMYTMSESHNIENQEFNKGHIIITTNLGGRGTDIKVTEEVNRCGGLFVLLTYFPNNRRVEKQVFGRTGRKGTPGMVQLILNHDHLAMAYRGHSIEVMRDLREEYEVNRIKDMEKEKLAEIAMKEELFSTFCQFLSDFDRRYNTEEKTDLFEVKVKDVPRYFESFQSKMDYHPALNALKESWGMWLILHTDQINIQNGLTELKEDLIQHLLDTSNKLLQGQSENLYDHIQQALGRTALHFQNKNKCDYGAKSYWKKVSDSDSYYRAVALYNQAYITINMAKEGYKSEARSLLEQAEKAIDVYVSETTKTLYFCSMSISQNFEPHHSGSCNFQIQMQGRMNIFNSWKRNIKKILDLLGSGEGDFKTVDLTLYNLSTEEDFVSCSELSLFRNYGLAVVFEVEKKPQFSFDALICCFLGVVQVVAGVLVCMLSAGSMSSFGLGLISEGVSDMISGVMGMINGTFDWASWAMSKAISIGISLACGGFSVLKRSFSSVKNAASNILNGTKSLKSVACSALRSGKNLFVSSCKSAKSVLSSSVTQISWNAAKPTLKHACKYAVQELAIQGVNTALNTCINNTVQKTFQQGFRVTFKNSICSSLKQNKQFGRALRDFISSGIPKAALEKSSGSYKISRTLVNEMKNCMVFNTKLVMNDLIVNCKEIHQVINTLSQVWDKSAEFVAHRSHACIKMLLTTTSISTTIYEMYSSIPTKHTIDNKFVPAFLKTMKENPVFETYDNDGRDKLEDVERLKDELIDLVSDILSQIMVESFSGFATSMFTKTFTQRLNSATGKVVGNLLGRHETQSFFVSQQHHYDLKSATKCKDRSLTEEERNELTCYANNITDEQKPATALEVHVLTNSNLLNGKGICITVVDHKGKLLTEETYPGTDPAAGTIKLVLTKTPLTAPETRGVLSKLTDWVMGKDTEQTGHIDIIRPDGSRETVNSSNHNCLFHAVIQATSNDPNDVVKQKAVELRNKISDEDNNSWRLRWSDEFLWDTIVGTKAIQNLLTLS
ncbi:uncharacterized protein LOC108267106 isoform X3 [Ictalurus punctatus]|uniref:Uncharacterized protein LOC108267106 isoform X3 n=1 Tax=Ictalurus punctatus TaxID=7998 RepID=A0A9F7R6I5_ICTPU|nr:uncharacterized protein LOC108267106 isoform X3 [Ictalurus punctatus]